MPIELSTALLSLAGVLASALVGYGIAERKLRIERRFDRSLNATIRDLLMVGETPVRRFSTICRHVKGLPEDEIRRALIQAGAIAVETEDGEECWGLTYRIKSVTAPLPEEPFSLVGVRYSTTASSPPHPGADLLEKIQPLRDAGIEIDPSSKEDLEAFAEVEYSGEDMGLRELPELSVSDNGAVTAAWHFRSDTDEDELEIEFHGGDVISFRRLQLVSGKPVRNWSGTDVLSGASRILAWTRQSAPF